MFKTLKYCYVYIIQGRDETFYTGITWNIRLRILRHNGNIWGGGRYTKSKRPWFLVHLEVCQNRKEARVRELQIKDMSRIQKEELILKTTKKDILSSI